MVAAGTVSAGLVAAALWCCVRAPPPALPCGGVGAKRRRAAGRLRRAARGFVGRRVMSVHFAVLRVKCEPSTGLFVYRTVKTRQRRRRAGRVQLQTRVRRQLCGSSALGWCAVWGTGTAALWATLRFATGWTVAVPEKSAQRPRQASAMAPDIVWTAPANA